MHDLVVAVVLLVTVVMWPALGFLFAWIDCQDTPPAPDPPLLGDTHP